MTDIENAAKIIREGGIVAFPTDTFYGLAVNPFNVDAIERIFEVKKRPSSSPILLLISDLCQLECLVDNISPKAQRLIERFWPGPLTIVFPAHSGLPRNLCRESIGIRLPAHAVSIELIRKAGIPVTATSANLTGEKASSTAAEVFEAFGDSIDMVLDGGSCSGDAPSTVIGVDNEQIRIIREGRIEAKEILAYAS